MFRILVADDEKAERELLSNYLKEAFGATIDLRVVENGRQAVTMATITESDILLLDIEMPGLSGLEAAKQIIAQREDVKIIFITAFPLFSYAQEALKLGALDYILKPVNRDNLIATVKRTMELIEAQKQLSQVASQINKIKDDNDENENVLIQKVRRYLELNYMKLDISLDSISEMIHLNSTYFSALFKKEAGVNFLDYLTDLRINAAKEYLRDPLKSSSEIASLVGYDSGGYFTRAFKKRTGMTLTEYRKSIKRNSL